MGELGDHETKLIERFFHPLCMIELFPTTAARSPRRVKYRIKGALGRITPLRADGGDLEMNIFN